MGSEKRPGIVDKYQKSLPGPGGYYSIPTKNVQRCHFGTEKRPEIAARNVSPAPGIYDTKWFTGTEGRKTSMFRKLSVDYKAKNDKLVPGPGSYSG